MRHYILYWMLVYQPLAAGLVSYELSQNISSLEGSWRKYLSILNNKTITFPSCRFERVCIYFLPQLTYTQLMFFIINPLNPQLNPICYLLALLAHHFLRVSRIRVKSLTLRLLTSYIYGGHILDVSRSHTTTHHSR